jgi:hypothetical protein
VGSAAELLAGVPVSFCTMEPTCMAVSVKEITRWRVEVDDALGALAGKLEPSSGHVAGDEVPRRMRGRYVSH